MNVIGFLANRARPVPSVRQRRALTAEECDWLDRLPAAGGLQVEFRGDDCAAVREVWDVAFFRSRVREALETGSGSVERSDGQDIAWFGHGRHAVQGAAPPSFFSRWKGGTHASRTSKD